MFDDLARLMELTEREHSYREYREELDEENILGKRTAVNKEHTARKLKALYGLDPAITIFRLLRHFWSLDDGGGRPLLALLCATARDPLLRTLTPCLLRTAYGAVLEYPPLEDQLRTSTGDRFSEKTLLSIARRASASWIQSGHLTGRGRIRQRPHPTPATAAYAVALGYLEGRRGTFLFDSMWTQLLDVVREDLQELVQMASQNGWLVYRGVGDVVEIRFPDLWTPEEQEALDDQV